MVEPARGLKKALGRWDKQCLCPPHLPMEHFLLHMGPLVRQRAQTPALARVEVPHSNLWVVATVSPPGCWTEKPRGEPGAIQRLVLATGASGAGLAGTAAALWQLNTISW